MYTVVYRYSSYNNYDINTGALSKTIRIADLGKDERGYEDHVISRDFTDFKRFYWDF